MLCLRAPISAVPLDLEEDGTWLAPSATGELKPVPTVDTVIERDMTMNLETTMVTAAESNIIVMTTAVVDVHCIGANVVASSYDSEAMCCAVKSLDA